MRIYISADMEGIGGIVHGNQTSEGPEFYRARKLMTAEVNAAVRGAFAGGATAVVVNDAHNTMRNIIIEELDHRATLISGNAKPLSMMEGIEQGFDGVLFIGYHAKAGAEGVIAHTYSGTVKQAKINGIEVGEASINGLVAAYFKAPVLMATGDDRLCQEVRDFFENIRTVEVKRYISRNAAHSKPLKEIYQEIEDTTREAVKKGRSCRAKTLEPPFELEVSFQSLLQKDKGMMIPGVVSVNPTTIRYCTDDLLKLYQVFLMVI